MASPWKFLSRLVSPRGQKGPASSAKLLDGGSLNPVEPPEADSSRPLDPADGSATPHGAPVKAVDHHQNTVKTDGSKVDDASEAAPAKRKRRTRTVEPVVAALKASPDVVAASDDEISLDDEIRTLRGQLVRKLRQQNAQLKKMLERFER